MYVIFFVMVLDELIKKGIEQPINSVAAAILQLIVLSLIGIVIASRRN